MAEEFGTINLIINVIALFLLVVGVVGRKGSRKVLVRHGYLSILGFVLKIVTVFVQMVPSLFLEPMEIQEFSTFQLWLFGTKITMGIIGTIMGLICIIPWFFRPLEEMACNKVRGWMMPTFIIWSLTVILGAIVHLGEIF